MMLTFNETCYTLEMGASAGEVFCANQI